MRLQVLHKTAATSSRQQNAAPSSPLIPLPLLHHRQCLANASRFGGFSETVALVKKATKYWLDRCSLQNLQTHDSQRRTHTVHTHQPYMQQMRPLFLLAASEQIDLLPKQRTKPRDRLKRLEQTTVFCSTPVEGPAVDQVDASTGAASASVALHAARLERLVENSRRQSCHDAFRRRASSQPFFARLERHCAPAQYYFPVVTFASLSAPVIRILLVIRHLQVAPLCRFARGAEQMIFVGHRGSACSHEAQAVLCCVVGLRHPAVDVAVLGLDLET